MDQAQVIKVINEKFPGAIAEEQPKAVVLKRESLVSVAKLLRDSELAFKSLHCISGVDRRDKLEVVYNFYSFKNKCMLMVKVFLPNEDHTVETLSQLWSSANWLERETFDLFGIKFLNHPDLRRILNPDEWTDYPLRKNFSRPDFYPLPQSEGLKAG